MKPLRSVLSPRFSPFLLWRNESRGRSYYTHVPLCRCAAYSVAPPYDF